MMRLTALAFWIERRKVNWIIDADIRAFFAGSRETTCCGSSTESGTNGYSG